MPSPARGPRMLVISDQDMLKAGNQLLFRAMEGYLRRGFEVVFLSHAKDDQNLADERELFGALAGGLRVVRPKVPPFLWGLPRRLRRLLGGRQARPAEAPAGSFPPPPDKVLPFTMLAGHAGPLAARNRLRFERTLKRAALDLAREKPFDLVCGYEVMAIPLARRVADRLGLPFFTRYQGTFLKHALAEGSAERLYPRHLAGSQVPADFYVMENDGTGGLEVLTALGHPRERILFMVDGVKKDLHQPGLDPAEVFGPHGVEVRPQTRVLLMLSKLGPWKRHDRMLGAMPAILARAPETWLVIAHSGPMRPVLEDYARELGVAHRVVFTGPQPHDQVDRLLNACHVYVNVNDWSNLSNTVLEALECGKPVLSLNDGSLSGIISHGQTGMLADLPTIARDLPEMALRMLTDDEFLAQAAVLSRRFAQANLLSWEQRMDVEIDLLEKLIA